jgi:hypothetical protein
MESTTEERPVHVVLNGSNVTSTPLTNEEWDAHKEREASFLITEQERGAQRAADDALIVEKSKEDPAFAALARAVGYRLTEPEGGTADEPASAPAAPSASPAEDGTPGQGSGPAPTQ